MNTKADHLFTKIQIDKTLLTELEAGLLDLASAYVESRLGMRKALTRGSDLANLIRSGIIEKSELFDLFNMSFQLAHYQTQVMAQIEHLIPNPIMSSYPNLRIDLAEDGYAAPAHTDEWISFSGHKKTVFWIPLFHADSLDIYPYIGEFAVVDNPYWGLEIPEQSTEQKKWENITVEHGKCLVFNSALIHRSATEFQPDGLRVSVQLRVQSLADVKTEYQRTTTQTTTQTIKSKRSRLLAKGFYSNE